MQRYENQEIGQYLEEKPRREITKSLHLGDVVRQTLVTEYQKKRAAGYQKKAFEDEKPAATKIYLKLKWTQGKV